MYVLYLRRDDTEPPSVVVYQLRVSIYTYLHGLLFTC
jgi:hypothetical protein